MNNREELNRECDELDHFCKSIEPSKLFGMFNKTDANKKKYSHKEIKKILLIFKHDFESYADNRRSDGIINTIHDPVCGCKATSTSKELKRKLLILKGCLEIICDYYCSDSIIDEYLEK